MWTLNHISRQELQLRTDITAAYEQRIADHLAEGYIAFYGNVMFNHISGGQDRKKSIMTYEVNRLHSLVTRHIVRERNASLCQPWRPILYGCHDGKVMKTGGGRSRLILPNGGFHFNFLMLLRIPGTASINSQVKKLAKTCDLPGHFDQYQHHYRSDVVSRVFVTPMNQGNMTNYMLKTFGNGNADWDDITILK